MMTEKFKFTLTRDRDDGESEVIETTIDCGDSYVTHTRLAEEFNRFLDSAGYVGHNYQNVRD